MLRNPFRQSLNNKVGSFPVLVGKDPHEINRTFLYHADGSPASKLNNTTLNLKLVFFLVATSRGALPTLEMHDLKRSYISRLKGSISMLHYPPS